jgi:hypothetical protein
MGNAKAEVTHAPSREHKLQSWETSETDTRRIQSEHRCRVRCDAGVEAAVKLPVNG